MTLLLQNTHEKFIQFIRKEKSALVMANNGIIISSVIYSICVLIYCQDEELVDILHREIPEKCKNRNQIEKSVEQTMICYKNDVKKALPLDLREQHRIDAEVREICQLDITRCFRYLGDAVEPCLSFEKYQEIINDPIIALETGQNYACSNNGQPLKDFLRHVPHCLDNEAVSKQLNGQCARKNTKIENKWFSQFFETEKSCREVFSWINCLSDAFGKCYEPTPTYFIGNLSLVMLNESPCQKFTQVLNEQLTSVEATKSSASIPTHNLIIVVILFSNFPFL
uniref:Uncharacterized protein n=1 Tax=Strigamia maritima TaxID=126957 RepID=T1J5L6_STRMM